MQESVGISTTPDYPARAVVDLDAIRDNVRALRAAPLAAQVMAVVKADAYGHGLAPAARAALAGGATWLGAAQERGGAGRPRRRRDRTAGPDLALRARRPLRRAGPGGRRRRCRRRLGPRRGGRRRPRGGPCGPRAPQGRTRLGRNGITPEDLPAVLDRAAALQAEGALAVVGAMTSATFMRATPWCLLCK